MKWKSLLLFISLLVVCISLIAQKEGNIWYFGENAGIDFNQSPPISLTNGQMHTKEGCATVCDKNGDLLFYTDGSDVWNSNHQVMPNGSGLLGNNSSTQSAVVIGWPNHDSLYIIFTVDAAGGPNGLNFSVINMKLSNGLGNVIVKNRHLYAPSCEKITAILHANERDIWILSHKWQSDEFYTYLVTDLGVQTTPRIQAIGNIHTGHLFNAIGYMKVSPTGDKVGLAIGNDGVAQLFDFDSQNGSLSNPLTLTPNLGVAYGLEFSPDGQYLYVGYKDTFYLDTYVYQYDINISSQAFINQAAILIKHHQRTTVFQPDVGALQLTPDNRIFITTGEAFLSSIEYPNVYGVNCLFKDTVITLAGRKSRIGLPTFNQSYFRPISIGARNTCIGDSANIFLTDTIGVDSVHWAFGDTAS